MSFEIKSAQRNDCPIILTLITELAAYEKMEDEVVATLELLDEWIFEKETAHVLLAYEDQKVVGYCLYCHNFSTFLGKAGIYIEDIYIRKEFRGKGYGKAMFHQVATIAHQQGYGRMDWSCLTWNKPSIEFYESIGAKAQEGWIGFRVEGQGIINLAKKDK